MTITTRNEVLVTCQDAPLMELLEHLEKDHSLDLDYCLENLGIVGTRIEEPKPRKLNVSTDFEDAPVGTIVDTLDGPHMKIFENGWLWLADNLGKNRTSPELVDTDILMSSKYIATVLWTPKVQA